MRRQIGRQATGAAVEQFQCEFHAELSFRDYLTILNID